MLGKGKSSPVLAPGLTLQGTPPGDRETGPRAKAGERTPFFVRDGARHKQTTKGKRRGFNFTLRLTEEERAQLESARAAVPGPRALGAWLKWRALTVGTAPPEALPGPAAMPVQGSAPTWAALPELVALPAPATGIARSRAVPVQVSGHSALPARGHCPAAARVILDLCAGSGAWSEPYIQAGYNVIRATLPERDVRTWEPPLVGVWGVLAAPPCDQFSLARNGHKSERDLAAALEVVVGCMRIVALARPRWWAFENPVGLLSRFLGEVRDVFDPCDFGDPWTKRTALWGDFELPLRGPYVKPVGGGPLCEACDPKRRKTTWCSKPEHRAVTPPGFARAFFEANP